VKFGAAKAAAVVGEKVLGQGRERIVGRAAAAVVVVGRILLGSLSGVLRAAVVGRHSRKTLGRREGATRSLGWSFARCAMERIEMRAVSSDAMTGGVEGAFESHVEAAGARAVVVADIVAVIDLEAGADTAVWEFERRELRVYAGYIATSCSYPDKAQGTVPVQGVLVGILSNHLGTEEVDRSCQIVVRCQSSNFPCHLHGGSSEQH
jgi:hypothetical protein